jgi:HlyD family secretion protein
VVNYEVKVEIQPLEAVELREGLTVTVSIVVQSKTDVLLVPYAAITSQEGQSYVQVVSPSGAAEKRAIKTGITDYNNTEVIEGLNEGEQVIVPQGTTTTSTTGSQQRPGGPIPFFGRRD